MENKLWCDLKTDAERIEFVKCGRAWKTGILSRELEDDIINLIKARIALKDAADLCSNGCLPNEARLEEWANIVRS